MFRKFLSILLTITLLSGCSSFLDKKSLINENNYLETNATPQNSKQQENETPNTQPTIDESTTLEPKPINEQPELLYQINNKINESIPKLTFSLYGNKRGSEDILNSVSKIVISKNGNTHDILQELIFEETNTPDDESFGFDVLDMNFDGYNDIRIQQDLPAAPNIPYLCWVWDIKTSQFIEDLELESITSAEFDVENKIITSFVRDSAAVYFTEYYKYENNAPVLIKIKTEKFNPDKNIIHTIVQQRINNEMQLTEEYDEPLNK